MKKDLSEDIELIKEIEELRIKQKILIDNLKHKKIDKYETVLTEILTKIEFLVKIFTDAKNDDADNEKKTSEEELNKKIDDKFSNLESTINSKFEDVKGALEVIKKELLNTPPVPDFKKENSTPQIGLPSMMEDSKKNKSTIENKNEIKDESKKSINDFNSKDNITKANDNLAEVSEIKNTITANNISNNSTTTVEDTKANKKKWL